MVFREIYPENYNGDEVCSDSSDIQMMYSMCTLWWLNPPPTSMYVCTSFAMFWGTYNDVRTIGHPKQV